MISPGSLMGQMLQSQNWLMVNSSTKAIQDETYRQAPKRMQIWWRYGLGQSLSDEIISNGRPVGQRKE